MKRFFLLLLLLAVAAGVSPASGAISANTVWEVRPGGSDTNGGGFVTGSTGTDWTLQNAAQYSVTDGVTAGTTTITSATANFGTDVVGNIMYVQGGTGAVVAGWYQITARNSATSVTVDRSTGLTAGTGVTLKIGGAFASPGMAGGAVLQAGNIVYIYNAGSTVYSITSASNNVANGCIAPGGNVSVDFIGYSTNRTPTTTDAKPALQLNVSTATIFGNSGVQATNLILDGNNQTTSKVSTSTGIIYRCDIKNMTGASAVASTAFFCTATGNSNTVFVGNTFFCEAYANTVTPFAVTNPATSGICVANNVSRDNTGAANGFTLSGRGVMAVSNVSVRNAANGFNVSGAGALINNIAESNALWGFNFNSASNSGRLINNAHYNNTSGGVTWLGLSAMQLNSGTIAVTAGSVFVDAAGNNFALNNLAGRGALLRGLGFPSAFPLGTTASYHDIGAAQHREIKGVPLRPR